ncbi:ATP-binding protein [Desulfobacterales bacterium HSG16]|nr:ATP-binding protein [Desulfobacterales bacterium HSG16]
MFIIVPVLGVIFSWAGIRSERNATEQILNQARILARQIILTRQWIADCGGIMVNQDTADPEKCIYALNGQQHIAGKNLTRFSPAMVTKKLSQYSLRENMYNFRLACLNPVNSNDSSLDTFERMALNRFNIDQISEHYSFVQSNKERAFRYAVPLYAEKSCMECHKNFTMGSVGGCLSIFFPAEKVKQSLNNTYFNLVFAGAAIILLTITTLFFLLRQVVIKPVNMIKSMAADISNGNHQARVNLKTDDEFEELGQTFNTMAEKLSQNKEIMQEEIATATLELYQANQELKKLDKLKTEFIADMSHELRSPVTAIQGGLDYLKRTVTKEDNKSYLTIIDNNLLRLTHLISDMLELTRIEAGKVTWNFEKNDMTELIREIIEILSLEAHKKSITFDFKYQDLVWVEMDTERIEQVLVNLIENAIKFSSPNSKILIRIRLEAQWVHVSVQDSGIGISDKDIETIFLKFHTLPSRGGTGQTKGTGLGLTICRKIIEAHKGRIWAESTESRGSVFHFIIPQNQAGENQ